MKPFLEVNVLGEFSVRWGNTFLVEPSSRVNKNIELFALLILNHNRPLSNDELTQALWEGEIANPTAALKNAVYSLRKLFSDAVPDIPFILTCGQHYQLNPEITLQADFMRFLHLAAQTKQNGVPTDSQLNLGKQAIELYKGDLIPSLSGRPWLLAHNHQLLEKYIDIVVHTSKILLAENTPSAAKEAFHLCSQTCLLSTQSEELYICLFRAMQQLQMKTAILNYYPVILEFCYNQLNKPVPRNIRHIYQWASENTLSLQEDLFRIRMELSETMHQELPLNGAYFCTYESLRHMYQVVARNASRNNAVLAIMLVSLHSKKNTANARENLSTAMASLQHQIRCTLRRGDIFCQYSRFQYAALLAMSRYEDHLAVKGRLLNVLQAQKSLEPFDIEIAFCKLDSIF